MKFFKSIATTILFAFFISATVNAATTYDLNNQLRESVQKMLEKPDFDKVVDESVRISFFVTTDGEIVVLKTDSRTKSIDKYIKARLNYKKTQAEDVEANRVYNMKVHFKTQ
ncbi:hypothetical protein [Membranihabitans maritimus]|uniref:hypothetical protein n=1 Tax=Membranihabitans maritimus TaxID=2904244 RepID=UPI001F398E3E|nr:hypothetical protein [Membranihabitans maritimus]